MRENVSKKLANDKIDLRTFSNLDGELTSRISNNIKDYSMALDELNRNIAPINIKYVKHSQPSRFEQLCKELLLNFNRLTSTITNLANCAGKLQSLHHNFNARVEFGKTETNEKLYEAMKSTFNQWANMSNSQVKMVENNLIKTFHFSSMEVEAHNEVRNLPNTVANQVEESSGGGVPEEMGGIGGKEGQADIAGLQSFVEARLEQAQY